MSSISTKRLRWLILALLTASCGWLSVGCATVHPDETAMPWTRQQEWENQGPGLPGGGR
jgi:hypothetical protein